ncbi:hypothetical protein P350_01325 [Burkholderia cepacia JBK9]|nr:hypothetical protein P350_01325 [Burkholderia cepacia JBK9]
MCAMSGRRCGCAGRRGGVFAGSKEAQQAKKDGKEHRNRQQAADERRERIEQTGDEFAHAAQAAAERLFDATVHPTVQRLLFRIERNPRFRVLVDLHLAAQL